MTVQELLDLTPSEILKRGRSYFDHGNIVELYQDEDRTWIAEVKGNYDSYQVQIETDYNKKITHYECNCPFDGQICKHIAAVALAIREKQTIDISVDTEIQEETWFDLIHKAKPEEIRKFILDYGKKNKEFRHQVKLTFSKPESVKNANNIPYYQKQISGIFEFYEDRGFIDYRSNYRASRDVDEFLVKADRYLQKGNLNEAFCIAAAIAMEGVQAIQHMDDSSGACGGAIIESFEIIGNVANHHSASSELKERIFNWLHEQVQNADYNDYGVGDSLEPLFFELAADLKTLDIAYKFIEKMLNKLSNEDGWSKKYHTQRYLTYKINLLKSEGRTTEAEEIIDAHLHLDEFRQIRITKSMTSGDFRQTEVLLLDGIAIADKEKLPGVVHQWKDQLLELYREHEKTSKFNQLARELFLENHSSLKYYLAFRESSPRDNWEKLRDGIIVDLKKQKQGSYGGVSLDSLAAIYIEEQMIEELFAIVKSAGGIHTLIKYAPHLRTAYSTELLPLYKKAIEYQAQSTGRNVYEALVYYLKEMAKLKGGVAAARELKNELLETYKNRPAMKEEFEKLTWNP